MTILNRESLKKDDSEQENMKKDNFEKGKSEKSTIPKRKHLNNGNSAKDQSEKRRQ